MPPSALRARLPRSASTERAASWRISEARPRRSSRAASRSTPRAGSSSPPGKSPKRSRCTRSIRQAARSSSSEKHRPARARTGSRSSTSTKAMPDTGETALSDPQAAQRHTGINRQVDKTLPRRLRMVLALDDFEAPARRYLPRPMYGYVSGGAETNASLRANRAAFDDFALLPRVLVDVSARSTKTTLFGRAYDAPFGIAPMGGSSMAAYQGDIVLARAAAAANVPMIMSGASLTRLEDVRAVGRTSWFQAYLP